MPLDLYAPPRSSFAVTGEGRPLHTCGSGFSRSWSVGWASHVGLRHSERGKPCEDSIAVEWPSNGSLHVVVADGVSGGACAAVASSCAANQLTGLRPAYPAVRSSADNCASRADLAGKILQVDASVKNIIADISIKSGAATLSCAWLSAEGSGWVCRIGDCRAWNWRVGAHGETQLKLLGEDQNYFQLSEARPPGMPLLNPARMLGNGMVGRPELWEVHLSPGEGLLLTSDGVHGVLSADNLATLLDSRLHGTSLDIVARNVERLARQCGSRDDVSVLILERF